jgi:C-terminal processing protease CtpA/Prc
MKSLRKISLLVLSFFLMLACNGDDDETSTADINDFVWKGLNSWYYWKPNVPLLADNAFSSPSDYKNFLSNKSPDNLFYSLLYDYPNKDRYSWIVDDVDALLQSFNGISKSSGIDFTLYYKDNGNYDVVGIINYVVPNSPASQAGLSRGEVIVAVNGSNLNINNYRQLLNDQFSLSIAQNVSVSGNGVTTSGISKTVSITAAVIEENPIAFYKTFSHNGKTVGYLVYNGFKSNYNDELNAAFAKMKQDQITDLILDLRYNGGGSVETAIALGQMITGQFTGSPYVRTDFNDKHNQYDTTELLSNKVKLYSSANGSTQQTGEQTINSLNLNNIHILTSGGTASASELTIDSLSPYINVVTVGAETYGKFVGSITLFDSPNQDFISYSALNKGHKWAMQPITFAYFNSNNDPHPTKGFIPDYPINNYDNFGNIKEFGNPTDPALSKALFLITGHVFKTTSPQANFNRSQSFIANNKTLKRFETELYIQNFKSK